MNISPISMNNADNYSAQKKKNPNFKEAFILRSTEMKEALKEKSTLKEVQEFKKALGKAGSRFFDSYINANEHGVIWFYLKFKDGFNWPWNSGRDIYLTSDCDWYKGQFEIPDEESNDFKIRFCYHDEKDCYHACILRPTNVKNGAYYLSEDDINANRFRAAKEAPVLGKFLEIMANGEVYGCGAKSYKLQYHPFATPEERQRDIEANKLARENAQYSSDEEIEELLCKYGVDV